MTLFNTNKFYLLNLLGAVWMLVFPKSLPSNTDVKMLNNWMALSTSSAISYEFWLELVYILYTLNNNLHSKFSSQLLKPFQYISWNSYRLFVYLYLRIPFYWQTCLQKWLCPHVYMYSIHFWTIESYQLFIIIRSFQRNEIKFIKAQNSWCT